MGSKKKEAGGEVSGESKLSSQSKVMENEQEMSLLNCLAAAQHFEKCLMGNYLSSQSLLQSETKQAAEQFFIRFEAVRQQYPHEVRYSGVISTFIDIPDGFEQLLELFAKTPTDARYIFSDIQHLVRLLLEQLGSDVSTDWDISKMKYNRRNRVRWKPHLPSVVLSRNEPANYLEQISKSSSTIVVVGDIRKSQDLMTYAENPTDYSENLVNFMTETRELVFENMGIFDKFTGDGFVAYFNEKMCKDYEKDFVECFLKFTRDEQEYAAKLFPEWVRKIRKHPCVSIGLSIGADVGIVEFRDEEQHFVAFGDSIVWATRMCAVGLAGELIVNNLLYHKIKDNHLLSFTERSEQTKSGENFLARQVDFKTTRFKRPHRSRQA